MGHLPPMQSDADRAGKLEYVITGPGRSGTTFLAHVFQKAGYDLGTSTPNDIGKNQPIGGGMEDVDFATINMRLQNQLNVLWHTKNPDETTMPDIRGIAEQERSLFDRPWPTVLKDPRFCDTACIWLAAGYKPTHVFLCLRSPAERNASITQMMTGVSPEELRYIRNVQRTYYQYFGVYTFILLCLEHDIPLTLVHYPRIGKDSAYAERTLQPFMKNPSEVIAAVWEASMYHQQRS